MKAIGPHLRKVLLFLILSTTFHMVNGQTFTLSLRNDVQISDRVLRFDLYLLNTNSSVPIELAGVQAGILVNPAVYNGGTLTVTIVPGSSQLNANQVPASVVWSQTQNTIKLTPQSPPGSGGGTIIGTAAPGTRVCTMQLSNSVPFARVPANLTFNFTTSPYPTKVSVYVNGINTLLSCNASNCFSLALNAVLNPVPVIRGNNSVCESTPGNIYTTQKGMTNYAWSVSPDGTITAGGASSDSTVTVTWNKAGAQSVSVNYDQNSQGPVAYPVNVINCQVSGFVRYNNLALDALDGITVTINGKSSTTGADGSFTVNGVSSGTWEVTASGNNKPVEGINSTDAGKVNYWFTHPESIENVRFLAGDVNMDLGISSADALSIQRNFVHDQPFTRPSWVFGSASGSGTGYPAAPMITVAGGGISNVEIRGLCTGDFNGSASPNSKAKGEVQNVEILPGELRNVNISNEFDLPVIATSKMKIGAISLNLIIPGDQLIIKDVRPGGNSEPVSYSVRGDILRIGWYSSDPIVVNPEDDLLILKLKAVPGIKAGKPFELRLQENPLNEIAGEDFEVISPVILRSDLIKLSAKGDADQGDDMALSIHPNPVAAESMIYYTLPSDGRAVISISNTNGGKKQILTDQAQTAGPYSVRFNTSELTEGVYFLSLKLHNAERDRLQTIKVVVTR